MAHSTLLSLTRRIAAAALVLVVACGGDETQPTTADHTPVSYTLSIDGIVVSPPYNFPLDQTVLVRLQFLNEEGEDLDDIESSHFAALTFEPGTLASAVRRADHHFQFDVTGETEGTGTITMGYGHDDAADETTLPAEAVAVIGESPGAQ
jgi:hypothetical protein